MQESLAASCKATIGYRQKLVCHPPNSLRHKRLSQGEQGRRLASTIRRKGKHAPQQVSTSRMYLQEAQIRQTTSCQIVEAQPYNSPPPCLASRIGTSQTLSSHRKIIRSSDRRRQRNQFLQNCSNPVLSQLNLPLLSPLRNSLASLRKAHPLKQLKCRHWTLG